MTAHEHDPTLVEALFAWWMDYDEGQANFQDLPKVVEGLIAAERERVLAEVEAWLDRRVALRFGPTERGVRALVARLHGGEGRG